MIAVDTNVLVRLLVDSDDEAQNARISAIFETDQVFIAKTVLLETAWLLRTTFKFQRRSILMAFRRLGGFSHVVLEDHSTVGKALDWFEQGMDFADALHLASCPAGTTFVTFDRSLVRQATRLDGTPPAADLAG